MSKVIRWNSHMICISGRYLLVRCKKWLHIFIVFASCFLLIRFSIMLIYTVAVCIFINISINRPNGMIIFMSVITVYVFIWVMMIIVTSGRWGTNFATIVRRWYAINAIILKLDLWVMFWTYFCSLNFDRMKLTIARITTKIKINLAIL